MILCTNGVPKPFMWAVETPLPTPATPHRFDSSLPAILYRISRRKALLLTTKSPTLARLGVNSCS